MEKYKGNITTRKLVMASFLTALSIIFTRFLFLMVPLAGLPALRLSFGESPIMLSGILFGPLLGGLTGLAADLIGVVVNPQGAYFPGFTLSSILWGVVPGFISMYFKKVDDGKDYSITNSFLIFLLICGLIRAFFSQQILSSKEGSIYLYDNLLSMPVMVLYIVVFAVLVLLPIFLRGKFNSKSYFSFDKIVLMVSISYIIVSLGLNTLWLSIMFKKGFLVLFPGRLLSSIVSIPMHSMIISIFSKYFKYAVRE